MAYALNHVPAQGKFYVEAESHERNVVPCSWVGQCLVSVSVVIAPLKCNRAISDSVFNNKSINYNVVHQERESKCADSIATHSMQCMFQTKISWTSMCDAILFATRWAERV